MIRVLQKADIERVVDIWLDTNLKAHYFIPGQYWKNNIDLVKEMLPQAEVYVYENDCQIEGFIGLNDEYMEGIFVRDEMQSQGIGKLLLNFVKEKKTKLYLNVYQKNTRAIHFYKEIIYNPMQQRKMQKKQQVQRCSSCTILVRLLTSCLHVAYKKRAKINPSALCTGVFFISNQWHQSTAECQNVCTQFLSHLALCDQRSS